MKRVIRALLTRAWELYRALNDVGVDVEFVLYPDVGCGISDPKQYADVLTRWVDWYNRRVTK